jgi:hypothetical protein
MSKQIFNTYFKKKTIMHFFLFFNKIKESFLFFKKKNNCFQKKTIVYFARTQMITFNE